MESHQVHAKSVFEYIQKQGVFTYRDPYGEITHYVFDSFSTYELAPRQADDTDTTPDDKHHLRPPPAIPLIDAHRYDPSTGPAHQLEHTAFILTNNCRITKLYEGAMPPDWMIPKRFEPLAETLGKLVDDTSVKECIFYTKQAESEYIVTPPLYLIAPKVNKQQRTTNKTRSHATTNKGSVFTFKSIKPIAPP